jgi:homoserine dehydrogenase
MNTRKELKIGLFGFGVVGQGIYTALSRTGSVPAIIKKICIKDPLIERQAPQSLFTDDRFNILDDPDINVVVEVINDSAAALDIVTTALKRGKDVVSASKKMIAENLEMLIELQRQTGRSLIYEPAACASIPVIRNLEEYYDNDLLHSVVAIVNGSTNFILTKMFDDGLSGQEALLLAQQSGYAESDPRLDIQGVDAANKLSLLLTHAFGVLIHPEKLLFSGIQDVDQADISLAISRKEEVRLVAQAHKLQNGKVAAFVMPQFVKSDNQLSFVKNEYNGVIIESSFADRQFFYGKGAGSLATASAAVSDISALRYGYRYEYRKLLQQTPPRLTDDYYLRVYIAFNDLEEIPIKRFEWVEEWHAGKSRKWIMAVIHASELRQDWWKKNNISLILSTDPLIEEVETRKLKKRSLKLAGLPIPTES